MNNSSPSSFNAHDISRFQFRDTPFVSLMNRRIYNVLLIASRYDMFILEDDGRVDEQIFNEYMSLSLRYPPRFTRVSGAEEALSELTYNRYELIICMPNMDNYEIFDLSKTIKELYPEVPIVLLTPFSKAATQELKKRDLSSMDYVFSWLGNSDLLLAIIKLIEDKMNVVHDVKTVGVQTILLVEDSVRFYSAALPMLYKYVLHESQEFAKEALNDHQRTLRMRGRPKILLARNYEEAQEIYNEYGRNMLGIISDMTFERNGENDLIAGKRLCEWIYAQDKHMSVIYASSEAENEKYAKEIGATFIDKSSKTFPQDLRQAVKYKFGFGDFIIIDPHTQQEIFRIKNLKDLQMKLPHIPTDSLYYHLSRNHFSRFFYTRAMFPVAEMLKYIDVSEYKHIEDARTLIYDAIVKYRRMKNTGTVAIFEKDRFDRYSNFARIGEGSMGGKGRGLAFVGQIVKDHHELNTHSNFAVTTPKTVVLCTDIFDEFMEANALYPIALSDSSDEEILKHFLAGRLPKRLVSDFMVFLEAIENPVAVRSSSLLEDSQYQPFAGIYATYMIPKLEDKMEMVRLMADAIKAVYASVFYKDSKAYISVTHNLIDQEKMAIVLQEVVGSDYGEYFYPAISGVARSVNYYPIGREQPEDGIVNMAMGLGRYIVDGGSGLRFSPRHPDNILQTSTLELALRDTQNHFFAIHKKAMSTRITTDEDFGICQLSLKDAEPNGPLPFIASTYDAQDQRIRHGYYPGGRKIISFANILQHKLFPLASTLDKVLKVGQSEMDRAVEIEFAVDITNSESAAFYILQIRPIVDSKELMDEDLSNVPKDKAFLFSKNALGNGIYKDVHDVVYLKTKHFDAAHNPEIALEIEALNEKFQQQERHYVLVGPGRWGSSDSWLGVPVKWSHISQARVIVELALHKYQIEPSQGTHFFQNLTSFGVGYFTVNPYADAQEFFDESYLDEQSAVFETSYLRHVRLEHPIEIKMNGRKKMGVVMKP